MEKGKAVAIVECKGLPTAIAFLDAALKSANVELLGLELAKGEGMVDVKLAGNVGAVKAATEAGIALANTIGGVLGQKIIPRPHENIECLLKNDYTMHSLKNQEKKSGNNDKSQSIKKSENKEVKEDESLSQEKSARKKEISEKDEISDQKGLDNQKTLEEIKKDYTCNLCKDPECPRIKGRPHPECLHYNKESDQ